MSSVKEFAEQNDYIIHISSLSNLLHKMTIYLTHENLYQADRHSDWCLRSFTLLFAARLLGIRGIPMARIPGTMCERQREKERKESQYVYMHIHIFVYTKMDGPAALLPALRGISMARISGTMCV